MEIKPLHLTVPYVMPFVISADGHQGAKCLIKGFALLEPNPFPTAHERHG